MEFRIQSQLQKKIDDFILGLNSKRVIDEMMRRVTFDNGGVPPNRDEVKIIIKNYINTLTNGI